MTTALAIIQPDELDTIQRTAKVCSKCQKSLSLDNFHRNKTKSDGYNSYCKQCLVEYKRGYRELNRDRINEQQREAYGKDIERKREQFRAYRRTNPERVREAARRWRERHPEYMTEWNKMYTETHPINIKAKTAVNNAVAAGRLPRITERQCDVCNAPAQEYHHWSYEVEHWLDVIPMCASCHKALHAEMKMEKQNEHTS